MNIIQTTCSFLFTPRTVAALACIAMSGMSRAEPVYDFSAISGEHTDALFTVAALKDGVVWLSSATIEAVAPKSSDLRGDDSGDDALKTRLNAEHDLFRPLGKVPYHDAIKRLLKKQVRFQVHDNFHVQCEVKRYRTTEDGREVGLKLGMQYQFR